MGVPKLEVIVCNEGERNLKKEVVKTRRSLNSLKIGLRGYTSMTPKLNKKLRALGLTYEVTNKGHVRIYPINQKGPSVFIPHSSGSCRVGRDIYSQLNNTFFPEY